MKECLLYEPLPQGNIKCNLCQVRCTVRPGKAGFCNTRLNRDGKLWSLIYGVTSAIAVDPIEKKPINHAYPGTKILSAGTRGCNFHCPGCQNWEISHDKPSEDGSNLEKMSPLESVEMAIREGCDGICWTYNEPTIWFEHTLEAAQEARKRGLYTAYITNGYITPEALKIIAPFLDIYRLDLKAFNRKAYHKISGGLARFDELLAVAEMAKFRYRMHVEVVTNVTPTVNDDDEQLNGMANWIATKLGRETPWHVTRFIPYLDLAHLPATPVKRLEEAHAIGKQHGLEYVYVGNVHGHPLENTYCPKCSATLVDRSGYEISRIRIRDSKCPDCGYPIFGRWERMKLGDGRRYSVRARR
ncbi:MAG: radical SAM domain-containing [Planctomycetota bacterium]|nr:MAG: radical SAM domain-containing [Planctomycetota bacterium]